MWEKKTVFILGGGPSLNLVDVDRLRGRCVIAVNMAFRLAPWLPAMFFGDAKFYDKVKGHLAMFAGLKVTVHAEHMDKPGILVLKKQKSPEGLSRDPATLGWNLSSGACAINLATLLGAKKIVLFGFDMCAKTRVPDEAEREVLATHRNDNSYVKLTSLASGDAIRLVNWHAYYPGAENKNPWPRFIESFDYVARDLTSLNIACVNATPDSRLTVFPIVSVEEGLSC